MPEVECQECFWQGDADQLIDELYCPECGSDDICDYETDEEDDDN